MPIQRKTASVSEKSIYAAVLSKANFPPTPTNNNPHHHTPLPSPSHSPRSTLLTEKGNWPLMRSALICLILSTNSTWKYMKINRGEFVCGHCSKIVFLAVQAFDLTFLYYSKKGHFFAQNIIGSLLKERFARMNLLINHHRTESANDHWDR